MRNTRTLLTALFGAAVLFGTIGAANATPWTNHHPRRAEVNHRLARQDHRINHDLRTGKITFHQARMLHREDRMIRANERWMPASTAPMSPGRKTVPSTRMKTASAARSTRTRTNQDQLAQLQT